MTKKNYPEVTKTIKAFKYFAPHAVDEAVKLFTECNGKLEILAGGTDLLPMMKLRTVVPEYVVNIKNIAILDYIREENGLRMGALTLTKISSIEKSDIIKEKYFSVYEAAKAFATPLIRNMATVGGNICRSSPSADMVPPLMVFDAELTLVGPKGERRVLLEDFFTGPGENLLEGEILTEILIPPQEEIYGTAFAKITRNSGDLAKINCAVKIAMHDGTCNDIRIVLGAVAGTPVRSKKAEEIIKGNKISNEIIEEAATKVSEEIAPITDVRSTADYRSQISKVLVRRLIQVAIKRIKEK